MYLKSFSTSPIIFLGSGMRENNRCRASLLDDNLKQEKNLIVIKTSFNDCCTYHSTPFSRLHDLVSVKFFISDFVQNRLRKKKLGNFLHFSSKSCIFLVLAINHNNEKHKKDHNNDDNNDNNNNTHTNYPEKVKTTTTKITTKNERVKINT